MINVLKILNEKLNEEASNLRSKDFIKLTDKNFLTNDGDELLSKLDEYLFNYKCPLSITTDDNGNSIEQINITSVIQEYLWHISDHATGIHWNIFISDYIDYVLHIRLNKLNDDTIFLLDDLAKFLILLHSGYFKECKTLINNLNNADLKNWINQVLTSADATIE